MTNRAQPAAPRIAMNDFGAQWRHLGADVHAALERVGAGGRYILGAAVARFETSLAARWGLAHAVGCASGLDALEIGLRALGVGPGDQVVTTPLSAFATTLAILRCGASPLFVDTDDQGLIDLDAAAAALEAHPDARCLLPVHLYGRALDLDRLAELKRACRVAVLEDCAQAIDATWKGRPVGSVGEAAAVSFYPTKNLGCLGDGGALLTADPELARAARLLRDCGQTARFDHAELGLNSRLDELHAAILADAFLPQLAAWTARRRRIAAAYCAGIVHPGVLLPPLGPDAGAVWHLFPLRVPRRRAALAAHLAARGIESDVHYPRLIPHQAALARTAAPRFAVFGPLARAGALVEQELTLPVHPYLPDEAVGEVIDAVNSWR
jgi:dTDP-3-amino-3,4,6-trideoxy-alpha-D-glucose transaminase